MLVARLALSLELVERASEVELDVFRELDFEPDRLVLRDAFSEFEELSEEDLLADLLAEVFSEFELLEDLLLEELRASVLLAVWLFAEFIEFELFEPWLAELFDAVLAELDPLEEEFWLADAFSLAVCEALEFIVDPELAAEFAVPLVPEPPLLVERLCDVVPFEAELLPPLLPEFV